MLRWWYLPTACALLAGCSTGKPHVDWDSSDPAWIFARDAK